MGRPIKPKANYVESEAAVMLRRAIARAKFEHGTVLKDIAESLEMLQPVVISHMASGRIGIPVDRATALADLLDMDRLEFTKAVLKQKHAEAMAAIDLDRLEVPNEEALTRHGLILDQPTGYGTLHRDVQTIVDEASRDLDPRTRWLSVRELQVIEMIRGLRPTVTSEGLGDEDLARIRGALTADE